MLAVDQRRHRGRVVAGVAEDMLVGKTVEQLEELVGDRLLHEKARPSEADLARIVVLSRSLASSSLEITVGEDE